MNRQEFRAAYRTARSLFRLADRFGVLPEAVYSLPRAAFCAANAWQIRAGHRSADRLWLGIRTASEVGINRVHGFRAA